MTTAPPSRRFRPGAWLAAALVVAMGWFYFWTAVPEWGPSLVAAREDGYYNLLVRGFLRGHAYLDAPADPFLATLADPWDPAQRANHGMADASYFQGHYYIYHGVSPAVLLFLPFRLLTGKFISETLAVPVFASVGLAASAWLILAVRRRYFPRASAPLAAACLLALGLGNMVPVLLRRSGFREVPIACAYACLMVALAALFQSLHRRRAALWLAGASAAFGLAVGARPLYLLACPAVLLPVWWEARERGLGRTRWRDRAWRKLVLAAFVPLGLIGLGLAWYNYLRFGHPVEFGAHYQFSWEDQAKSVLFSGRFLASNLRAYWLAPAGWSRYFPFVTFVELPPGPRNYFGVEDPYGILPNLPFALLALGAFAFVRRGPPEFAGRLRVFGAAVALPAIALGVAMLFFQSALNRYMVDFTPAIMLLACLGLLGLTTRPWCRGAAATAVALAAGTLSLYSAGFNVLASLRHNELFRAEHPALYQRIAHRGNELSWEYDRWRGTRYGPIELHVMFPAHPTDALEPLVVTGRSFLSDYLFVQYPGPDSVQFGLEHTSRGTYLGEPARAAAGQEHIVRVDLGSLYPPAAHPYFDAMPPFEARLRQGTVRVTLDGRVVLDRVITCYEAQGPHPSLGTSAGRPGFPRAFSGRILSWRRLPDAPLESPDLPPGAFRLKLTLPPFTAVRNEPLLCTGETGRGDLVYVRYLSARQISFGCDHWGTGGTAGPPCAIDPDALQTVDIDFGALHPIPAGPASSGPGPRGRLLIRLNGQTALDKTVPYYPCAPSTIAVGLNPIQASTTPPSFTGELVQVERRPEP